MGLYYFTVGKIFLVGRCYTQQSIPNVVKITAYVCIYIDFKVLNMGVCACLCARGERKGGGV